MSRTQDLINQIKQITVEIRDIKKRKRYNIDQDKGNDISNVYNHTPNGLLQERHEEHDEGVVHYDNNGQTVLPRPDSTNSRAHYAPTPLLPEEVSTASLPPPPELHPSSPSNGSPSKPTSKIPPWSNEPDDPESPGNEGDNAGGVVGLPWMTTKGTPSGGDESAVAPADNDKKVGV